ncbi:Mur ligase [Pisolithus marmoratus]|nr:Mur ligase [Pisolithus marmoratus]
MRGSFPFLSSYGFPPSVYLKRFFRCRTMSTRNYQDAIEHLNSLQTNAAALQAARAEGPRLNPNAITEMIEFLERIEYTCEDLNTLNVIHITGTKGKGSTSAFTDSILRHAKPNWKVGLYTSPHLVAVRERIRINGKPLSEEDFAKYFFEVWDRLQKNGPKTLEFPVMPNYFRYLTLMAFHTFLSEKVNATILEVGIGGAGDSTNIVPRPIVTGITTLGLDHTAVLGKTIGAIAWQKGGIYKPEEGMEVLKKRAEELQAAYFMEVPSLPESGFVKLGTDFSSGSACGITDNFYINYEKVWLVNIKFKTQLLLLQMAHTFLHSVDASELRPELLLQLSAPFLTGLEYTRWPGRCQTVVDPNYQGTTWYLDGAHTAESLSCCMQWFIQVGLGLKEPQSTRVLIFNCTSGRSGPAFLGTILEKTRELLLRQGREETPENFFSHVIFCSNVTYADGHFKGDLTSRALSNTDLVNLTTQHELANAWSQLIPPFPSDAIHVLPSIEHAIQTVRGLSKAERVDVLVTGSLHLVGGIIEVAGLASVALE